MTGNISYANLSPSLQRRIDTVGGGSNSFFKQYPLTTATIDQKTWDLPADSYDAATDSLVVFHNTVYLEPTSYTITGTVGAYKINIPDNPNSTIADNNLTVLVLKNVPEEMEQVSGTLLTDGSVGLAKLGQDVQDALANVGSTNSAFTVIAPVVPTTLPNDSVYKDRVTTFSANSTPTLAKEWVESVGLVYNSTGNGAVIRTTKDSTNQNRVVQEAIVTLGSAVVGLYIRISSGISSWGKWKKQAVDIVDDLTTGGADKVASAETVKTLEASKASNTALNTTNVVAQQHYQSIATTEKLGHVILVDDLTTGGTTKALSAEQGKVLFQSVSNGKALVASAITGKGVTTASDATFQIMADNINAIQAGGTAKELFIPNFSVTKSVFSYPQKNLITGQSNSNKSINADYSSFKPSYIFMEGIAKSTGSNDVRHTFSWNYNREERIPSQGETFLNLYGIAVMTSIYYSGTTAKIQVVTMFDFMIQRANPLENPEEKYPLVLPIVQDSLYDASGQIFNITVIGK